MWYQSTMPHTGSGSETYKVKYATSSSGTSWTTHGTVFRRSSSKINAWDVEGVSPRTVINKDGQYRMWYGGRNSNGIWAIGYATSNDGIDWNRHSVPVLQASLSWEGHSVGAPTVIYEQNDNLYHMYYHAGNTPHFIGHATSPDGINWTKDPDPVLERGNCFNGDFDCNMIAAPRVLKDDTHLRIYYSGNDGATWRIGMAEEPLPQPTPTPSPTPSPSTVPYYLQSQMPWGDDEYDNASVWAEDKNFIDMASYGCAVTSAAMVLRYHGVDMTPGNPKTGLPAKELDPGSLNEWLKDVEDGDFRNGVTNFESIAKMTTLSHALDSSMPKLEYSQGFTKMAIDEELNNNRPPILKMEYLPSLSDMHFLVATGSVGDTYSINDPYYEDRKTLSPHYQTLLRVDKFVPTNSDFSYLILAIDENVDIELLNSNTESVGEIDIEYPIFNQEAQAPSGAETLKVLYFKHPPAGEYTLKVTSNENTDYQLDTYIYDIDGDGGMEESIKGVVGPEDTDTVNYNIDPENSENSTQTREVTFDSFQTDIKTSYELGWIKHVRLYQALLRQAKTAENMYDRGFKTISKAILQSMLPQLDLLHSRNLITKDAHDLLIEDINILLDQF